MIEIQEKDIRKVSAFRGKQVPFLFLRTEEIQDDGKRFFQTDAAGGRSITDSALLLYLAKQNGCDVHAYYVKTAFQPEFELEDARRLAGELDIPMTVVELDILAVPEAAANGPDRCYYCKRAIFTALQGAAREDGYTVLLDGTNASDDAGDRPGMRALRELGVRSPLRECGITKAEVRRLSREAGLFTWEKPAYACLATRIPTGTAIRADRLQAVERAEMQMREMGFQDFRVRMYRIQVRAEQFALALEKRKEIMERLGGLFDGVLLDLNVRAGSPDMELQIENDHQEEETDHEQ